MEDNLRRNALFFYKASRNIFLAGLVFMGAFLFSVPFGFKFLINLFAFVTIGLFLIAYYKAWRLTHPLGPKH